MSAFTTIAAATVSIGGSVAKGALAGDAAKTAAREAGRFRLQQEQLEKESIAILEQNFYDAVRATTDVYDKQLERGNVMGAQILEAVQEGDQRGVAAAAGKVKQVQDATLGATADKFAKQKLDIDMARAKAGEMSASEIAAFQDDRAASAGLKADALTAQSDQLKGQSTGAFIDAGVSALQAGVNIAEGFEGKANEEAAETLSNETGIPIDQARADVSKLTNKERRDYNKGGVFPDVSGRSNIIPEKKISDINVPVDNTQAVTNVNSDILQEFFKMFQEQKAKELEDKSDFNSILNSFKNGTYINMPGFNSNS